MLKALFESATESVMLVLSTLIDVLVLSLIFWVTWVWFGIGAQFFGFLPPIYLTPGFGETFGVFVALAVFKEAVLSR